jgi:steroid 5-alpha reductase family enzyme
VVTAYFAGLLAALTAFTGLWLVSLRLKDSSIVDIFWSLGFILVAIAYAVLLPEGLRERKLLSLLMVLVWGLRLSIHLARRNWGRPEDYRYAAWREQYGAAWPVRSLFQVFWLQAVLLWIVSAPLLAAQASSAPLTILDAIGAAVWLIGLAFEAVGDAQLARFKADPANKGKVLDTGLWRYTRHPNYFGDAMVWWGIYLVALSAGGWWTIYGPALMTYLLVRVSGVAMLEQSLKDKKPEYAEYIRRTSAFIPMPPKA